MKTVLTLVLLASVTSAAEPLLKSGDKVVLLGGTLIEREQVEGYWETQVTAALPFPVSFRNLGWSGDNVWCESRGMFDPPAKGYERMLEQIKQINPTVIILGYGNSEAFAGPAGMAAFEQQYAKLMQDLQAPDRRFILLTPLPMEVPAIPGTDRSRAEQQAATYNAHVKEYAAVIHKLGTSPATVIDLGKGMQSLLEAKSGSHLTDNGITLNGLGYFRTGQFLSLVLAGKTAAKELSVSEPKLLSVSNWSVAEDAAQVDKMRALIRRKNELLFHRWRPQNFTYLFGFRQHEQGNNAVEIPQFDPLVADLEQQIWKLSGAVQ